MALGGGTLAAGGGVLTGSPGTAPTTRPPRQAQAGLPPTKFDLDMACAYRLALPGLGNSDPTLPEGEFDMARKTMLQRSIAMLAVSGSLLAGGVVAATQAQAATNMVRPGSPPPAGPALGTVEVRTTIMGNPPNAGDNADALTKCKTKFPNRARYARYISKYEVAGTGSAYRGVVGTSPFTVFVYRCWGY